MNRQKILIVEDNQPVAENIAAKLMKHGYEITGIASDSDMAFYMLKKNLPDLILIDLDLRAEFDGIEIANIISKANSLPVLFLASYTDEEYWSRAEFIGIYDYLAKPYRIVDIVVKIKQMLESQREIKKVRNQELGRLSLEKAFVTVNQAKVITFANFQAGRLLNSNPVHLIGEPAEEILKIFDRKGKKVSDFYFSVENPNRSVYESERMYLTGTKGNRMPVKIQSAPILNEEHLLLGTVIAIDELALEGGSEISKISSKADLFQEMFERIKEGNPTLESIIHVHTMPGEGNLIALRTLEKAERRTEALNFLEGNHREQYLKGEINVEIHLKNITQNLVELFGMRTFEEFQQDIQPLRLPAFTGRCIGIITGELVTNSLVHSKGTELVISLRQLNESLDTYELLVKDNGLGFDPEEEMNSKGAVGFEIVRHITSLLKAKVRVESSEHGTEVFVSGSLL